MIYDLLEIIPSPFRLYNKSYDSTILYFNTINRGISAHAFPPCGGLKRDCLLLGPGTVHVGHFSKKRGFYGDITPK